MNKPNIGDIVGYTSYSGTKQYGFVTQKKRNGFMVQFFDPSYISQFWVGQYDMTHKWFIVD